MPEVELSSHVVANEYDHTYNTHNDRITKATTQTSTDMEERIPEEIGDRVEIPGAAQPTNAPTASATTSLSAITDTRTTLLMQRYKQEKTLHTSLFGEVRLAIDLHTQKRVALKISVVALTLGHTASSSSSAAHTLHASKHMSHALTRNGSYVLEDVRREARLLRLIAQPLETHEIDPTTWGLNVTGLQFHSHAQYLKDATIKISEVECAYVQRLNKGRSYIAHVQHEIETPEYHVLVTDYVNGGDLFTVLRSQPRNRVNENIARRWFYEACSSLRYLHARSIAHLDLSLENFCVDEYGHLRMIDFGLAVQHPDRSRNMQQRILSQKDVDASTNHSKSRGNISSNHIQLWGPSSFSSCSCVSCKTNSVFHRERLPRHSRMKFLCKPICQYICKPGKPGYVSPELYHDTPWDAYKQDIFALGVLLYSMLTGTAPFKTTDINTDLWFRVIYDGSWLDPRVRLQQPASAYHSLSLVSLDLINQLIKPQEQRPSIDEIMKHPFFYVTPDDAFHPATVSVATSTATTSTATTSTATAKMPLRTQSG